jgi:hypothetical protein
MKHMNLLAIASLATVGMSVSAMAEERLRMATIAPGSSAYLVMTTMATTVNEAQDDYDISVDATGAATKHMVEAAKGKLDIVMSSPVVMHLMQNGKAMYQKLPDAPELSKNLGLIYWFPFGAYHAVVYEDSGIKKLSDLRGKKVFLGPPGGGAWNTANQWVQATTGMKANEDFENVKASWGAALQGFQDRQFDAYMIGGIPPFPQIEQLALTSDIRILGLTKAELDAADEATLKPTKGLGRTLEKISADVYGDGVANGEDVYTVGAVVGVVARMDLSEDAVYAVTKTFWENIENAYETAPYMRKVTLENALAADNMKLHPGALKYYEEIGLPIPEKMK